MLPELLRLPPRVHHLPGGFSRTPAFLWSSHCSVNAGLSRGPPGSFSRLKAGSFWLRSAPALYQHVASVQCRWTEEEVAQWEWAWGAWGGGGADGGGKRGDQLEKRGRRSWVACSEVGRPGLGYLVPSQGGRGQAAHGALHVLCSAPGLLLPVGEGPVHSWLQHVPRHPHDCHGHPVSFPVRFPTAFK